MQPESASLAASLTDPLPEAEDPRMEPDRARQYPFAAPRGSLPLRVSRAEGAYFYTPDPEAPSGERAILDASAGAIIANLGHGRPEPGEAFARASARTSYALPPFATEERVELVERLRRAWLPPELNRMVFTSGGSESVDAAIRLARQHHVSAGRTGRWKVIGRDLSYHGVTLATLAVGGHERRRQGLEPWLPDLPKAPACYCLRCPFDRSYPECEVACASALEELIEREGADTIAAFVAEPIGGSTAGALVPPDEYWPTIVEICRRHGILVIADEVMTGFGRTGVPMAVNHWQVVPDVLVGGKGLGCGYVPIGGVFAREEVVAPIVEAGDEVMFFTYSGHPPSCAAANAALRIVEEEKLVQRCAETGARLRARLDRLADHPHVGEVRGRGLLLGIEIVKDRRTLEPFPAKDRISAHVTSAGVAEGVFFYPGGCEPARDVVLLGPPFVIGDDEIEKIASGLERAIDSAVSRAA